MRIVHDRHEEVGGGHNRLFIIQHVHRSVIVGLGAYQQRRIHEPAREFGENFRERGRRDLATTTAAMRQAG